MRYKYRYHPSKLSTLMVIFGAGGRVEFGSKYPMGIAHFMEHMRFKGTSKYTAQDLLKKTADAGGSWNAWTSEDLVAYHMKIPDENIETAFECLSEIVFNPVFPEEEIAKEQEVVCQEVRMYDDDIDTLVHYKLMESMFNNALSKRIVGTEESVQAITRQNLLDFNQEFYSKEHMMVALASPVDHAHLVDKYFTAPDDIWAYKPRPNNIDYLPAVDEKVFKEGQLQDVITISFGSQDIIDTAKNKQAVHSVFNKIFGAGDTSRLFMAVREELGLVYGIGSYASNSADGAYYQIYTSTEPENRAKVMVEVDKQIHTMIDTLPTEEELNRAKNKIRSAMYARLDTSHGAISEIVNEEFYNYKTGSQYLAEVDAVTAEDVHDLARKIFSSTQYIVIGTGK